MLFTFPSRYWFAIGLSGVFSLAGWSRLFHAGFLVPRATQGAATAGPRSGTGLSPAMAGVSTPFPSAFRSDVAALLPRRRLDAAGLGSSPFARRYWGKHVCSLLLRVLRCFSSPRSPPHIVRVTGLQPAGLPHSDIRGSQGACPSPRLFAACRVLPRLREPRYPPSALLCFSFPRIPHLAEIRVSYYFLFLPIMSKIFIQWRIRESNP